MTVPREVPLAPKPRRSMWWCRFATPGCGKPDGVCTTGVRICQRCFDSMGACSR